MKKLLFLFVALISSFSFAQLDREHWFAPMIDRSGQSAPYQSIYMSTGETTPFTVDIFSNKVKIGSVTISKNNPGKFRILAPDRNKIITTSVIDLFKPIGKGIYLKGAKPFFANLRFSVNQHAEIVTSKGRAGVGKDFYTSPAPIRASLNNVKFMTSIMATKDNTLVTITGFKPNVIFSDGVQRPSFSFTLNEGQSYIIDGRAQDSSINWDGFIGAKISATEDITVTNGNFNGQYTPTSASSTDILMDQSVPVEMLGKEFSMVKGNGDRFSGMEGAYIIASANDTNIYVNNETTPVNPTPLNAGQYFVIPGSKYLNQGFEHYNM